MADKPYLTRGRKLVYYLFLFAPFFFVLHIFLMAYMIEWEPIMPEALFTYYFAACGLLAAFLAKPAGRFIWNRRKALVRTPDQFEPAYFGVSMIPIASAVSTGMFGVTINMMTGDVLAAVSLNVVSFFAVLYNIPRREEARGEAQGDAFSGLMLFLVPRLAVGFL